MGCATTTVKIASIVFNTFLAIFSIAAIVLIALYPDALPNDWIIPAYIICALIIIFAILGCFAALRESICLTVTCAVFLLLLAILQAALTIVVINDRQMQNGIAEVEFAWDNNKMDALQKQHQCCGKDSAQDYVLYSKDIPASCYANPSALKPNDLYLEGCNPKLQRYYDGEITRFATASWILIAVEVIGFLLAVFLVINFRNKQRRMQF